MNGPQGKQHLNEQIPSKIGDIGDIPSWLQQCPIQAAPPQLRLPPLPQVARHLRHPRRPLLPLDVLTTNNLPLVLRGMISASGHITFIDTLATRQKCYGYS